MYTYVHILKSLVVTYILMEEQQISFLSHTTCSLEWGDIPLVIHLPLLCCITRRVISALKFSVSPLCFQQSHWTINQHHYLLPLCRQVTMETVESQGK